MVDTESGQEHAPRGQGQPPQARPSGADLPRIGRRIAWGIYWFLAVYVCAAGLRSALPQVFWPHASVEQEHPSSCEPVLESLADDLAEGALLRPEPLRREHFAAWDHRLLALHDACGERPAYDALYRARYAVETHAQRNDDDAAPLLDEARAAVRSSGD